MCQAKDTVWLSGNKNKTPKYAVYKWLTSDLGTLTVWKCTVWKKIFHTNGNQKKAGVAMFISDKRDFKIKTVIRDNKGYYIMIKGSVWEDITIINIYAPNIGAPQYIRQMLKLLKSEIDSNTIIVGGLIYHSHQWTDNPDRKLRKYKL